MTTTLSDVLLSVAEYCLPIQRGAATSGATTYLVDNVFLQSPGQYTNGIIFFLTGANAGKYAVVTDYNGTTGTFAFAAQSSAIVAGVQYAAFAVRAGINLYDLIRAINQALRDCGEILTEDITSLTTVADQEEYDIETDSIHINQIRKVEIAQSLTAPYTYRPNSHWDERNGILKFPAQFAPSETGYKMRITYLAPHAVLDTYEDKLSPHINKEWLKYTAALNLFRSLANRGTNTDTFKLQYEEASQRVITMRALKETVVLVHGA